MVEDLEESIVIEAARERHEYMQQHTIGHQYLWWWKAMELMLKVIDNYRKGASDG